MIGMTGILVVGLTVGAGSLGAAVVEPGPERSVDTVQAAALEREAESLFGQRDQWRRAAGLLERAAEYRLASDPQRIANLVMAGQIHGHLGNAPRAERLLTRAADEAHARGALLDAARAYLSAAEYAIKRSQHRRAAELVDRAELLAGSPHLSGSEQASIRARLPQVRRG